MTNYHKGFNPDTFIRRARKERSQAFWTLFGGANRAEEKSFSQR